jgi:hypothetical protein
MTEKDSAAMAGRFWPFPLSLRPDRMGGQPIIYNQSMLAIARKGFVLIQ